MPVCSYYLWEPPGHLTTVELGLDVVDRLNALIRQTTVFVESDGTGRPLETGAILLGQRLDSGAITVDDFAEIPSEHRRGASFTLSVHDQVRLGRQLEELSKEGSVPVGYFRIHTRSGLYLDHDDDLVIRQFFADPWQVVLLAKPRDGMAPEAGFFFWDDGEMDRRQSVLPFTLDRAALTADGHTIIETPPPPAPGPTPTPPPAFHGRNWIPVAGAVAMVALAAIFIPTGVFSRGSAAANPIPAAVTASPAPPRQIAAIETPPVEPESGSWPSADEVRRFNARAAQRARLATHPAAPTRAQARGESAVGPAPGREEVAMYSVPQPPTVLPNPAIPRLKPRPIAIRPEVSLEPVHHSIFRSTVGHLPLIGKVGRTKDDFTPARPRRDRAPAVPIEWTRGLRRDEPVIVRLHIAKNGEVQSTELISRKANPLLASLAVHAAAEWAFEPARIGNKPVSSDMLVHFRFRTSR